MTKLSDPRKREEAFKTYCRYRDVSVVAQEQGVTLQTVYNWRREDHWDDKLSDITSRFQGVMNVLHRASEDLVMADMYSEVRLLEFLELQAGQSIITDGLRPKTWNEALATLKFVMDRKDRLFDRVKKKPSKDKDGDGKSSDDTSDEPSDEQKKEMKELFRLVGHIAPSQDPVDSPTGVSPKFEEKEEVE